MGKEVMTRRASDNRYLHRDFHNILNVGLDYLADHFGAASVVGYLTDFARHFHAPEIARLKKEGLSGVEAIFRETYRSEDAEECLSFTQNRNALFVHVSKCPAVAHIRTLGDVPSVFYPLTTSVVWREIAGLAGIGFEQLNYDSETGKADYLFFTEEQK